MKVKKRLHLYIHPWPTEAAINFIFYVMIMPTKKMLDNYEIDSYTRHPVL